MKQKPDTYKRLAKAIKNKPLETCPLCGASVPSVVVHFVTCPKTKEKD